MKRPRLTSQQCQVIWITVFVFLMLIVVNHYRPNDLLIAASLAIAVYMLYFSRLSLKSSRDSLELARKGLELTSMDVKTRVRPFLSVTRIDTLIPEHLPTEGFSIFFRNTGSVPATKVQVNVSFAKSYDSPLEHKVSAHFPLVAPGQDFHTNISPVSGYLIEFLTGDGLMLRISVDYEGLGVSYQTIQSYKLYFQPSPPYIIPEGFLFTNLPVEPSSFT